MKNPVPRPISGVRAIFRPSAATFAMALFAWAPLSAEMSCELRLDQTHGQRSINWPTRAGHSYQLQASPDLDVWKNTSVIESGTGTGVSHTLSHTEPKQFFRVRETVDPYDGSFLAIPVDNAEVDLAAGVCFAVELAVLPELPARIHFYQRPSGTNQNWKIIGTISELAEIDGIRFVRGSVIWIPETAGHYEVQAAVVNDSGAVVAVATRSVLVTGNTAPSISITGGPASPSPAPQPTQFDTEVTDTEHSIRYVEFFDNAVSFGIDHEEPFGDLITGPGGETYGLLRGTHQITAKACDKLGAIGETPEAYEVVVTEGNARPELTITSPQNGSHLQQGDDLTISFSLTDADGDADLARVDAVDIASNRGDSVISPPFDALIIDTDDWAPGSHVIRVSASDLGRAASYSQFLTIYVDDPGTPGFAEALAAMIADPLSAAPSNVVFTGIEASSSQFNNGFNAGLQLDSGVLLSSGLATLWNGGDISDRADELLDRQFANSEEPGDPVLDQLVAGFRTVDAAALEFDVFCTDGQLEIEYQFGSEEYDSWVGEYNDAFLITVDGVATSFVPDCSDIVAVNSVNAVAPSNEHLYLDDDQDILPSVPPGQESTRVEYDGMTIRLLIHAFVTPNRNHRVRFVIADVNDSRLDSALLIGANSVRSVSPMP